MSFSEEQQRQLQAKLRGKFIRNREVNGRVLSYIEGWHVVSEANRVFGFDGWDRETLETKCVWTKQSGDRYSAAYVTRVRIGVTAGDRRVIRDGTGAGEATAETPGQAHEIASKAAETDAMKRAFITFGNPFGLSLYSETGRRGGRATTDAGAGASTSPTSEGSVNGHVPEPEPREAVRLPQAATFAANTEPTCGSVDKSALPISEPKRERSSTHLRFVASRGCVICGRNRAQAHHLTFAQPRALGRKSSDEFAVPLCSAHHRELHHSGNERAWWDAKGVDPLPVARALWAKDAHLETNDAAGQKHERLSRLREDLPKGEHIASK